MVNRRMTIEEGTMVDLSIINIGYISKFHYNLLLLFKGAVYRTNVQWNNLTFYCCISTRRSMWDNISFCDFQTFGTLPKYRKSMNAWYMQSKYSWTCVTPACFLSYAIQKNNQQTIRLWHVHKYITYKIKTP